MGDSPRPLLVSPAPSDVSGKKSSKCGTVNIDSNNISDFFCKESSLEKINQRSLKHQRINNAYQRFQPLTM